MQRAHGLDLSGCVTLSDEQLVATVLSDRAGCEKSFQMARELLQDIGGLAGLTRLRCAASCFSALHGFAGQRLLAALELGLRCSTPKLSPRMEVHDSQDVIKIIGPEIRHLMHEQLWMLGLDCFNAVMFRCCVAQGQAMKCCIDTCDVLRMAVQLRADAFILVHNHPSNDPRPSEHDIRATVDMLEASILIGIPLLDHIIVTQSEHRSMLQMGLLPDLGLEQNQSSIRKSA